MVFFIKNFPAVRSQLPVTNRPTADGPIFGVLYLHSVIEQTVRST